MSDRITSADLTAALAAHVNALAAAHITYDGRLILDHGSRTYGRAYRLYRIPSASTDQHEPPIGSSFLGHTAREAYDRLQDRTTVLFDVAAYSDRTRTESANRS